MRIYLQPQRIEEELDLLITRLRENDFPYNSPYALLPQRDNNITPKLERGSVEHAMFLFCLCYYMRGGIRSDQATRCLSQLYKRRPGLFNAEKAANASPQSIRGSLVRVKLSYMKQHTPIYWIENAKLLCELYDGDPRKIYAGTDSWDEICLRIQNRSHRGKNGAFTHRQGMLGFQEKMASMLTYYLMEAELIEPFHFPVPVDFHVMRVAVATEMVTFEDLPEDRDVYTDEMRSVLRNAFHDYAIRHDASTIEMANAMWLLSRAVCSQHVGNRALMNGGYQARRTDLSAYQPIWDEAERQKYAQTCGQCPVEHNCALDIPNAMYTRQGKLLALRPHSKPPV